MLLTDAVVPTHGWRKASYSVNNGQCVETTSSHAVVLVRDSADTVGPVVSYPADAWRAFLANAKADHQDGIR